MGRREGKRLNGGEMEGKGKGLKAKGEGRVRKLKRGREGIEGEWKR